MWFVFDKIFFMPIDYAQTCKFRFECNVLDSGSEEEVKYECNDETDFIDDPNLTEVISRIDAAEKAFDEEKWVSERDEEEDRAIVEMNAEEESCESATELQNYRYENFVLNKFKKLYLEKTIRIDSGNRTRYVNVIDFNIEFGSNTLPKLYVSGQTVDIDRGERRVSFRMSDFRADEEKKNVMHFIGYIDEMMLLQKNQKPYVPFSVLNETEVSGLHDVIVKQVREEFEKFIHEIENDPEVFRNSIY